MALIEHDLIIHAPISEVWGYVTDLEGSQSWQTSVTSTSLTSANPLRIGTMVAQRKRFMGREQFMNADVTELKRNKELELKGMFANYPFRRTIRLEPRGRETRITDEIFLQSSWVRFWLTPFVTRALNSQTKQEWNNLKEMLE